MIGSEHGSNPSGRRPKREVLDAVRLQRFIPIVRVKDRRHAMCAVEGITRAGVSLIEITLTIPDALVVIEETVARFGEQLIVGAGTVLGSESCRASISAGASFVVSPATDIQVIQIARAYDVVAIPGALTPTEVLTALQAGADLIKIFPAGHAGGPAYIRALRGPYPEILLVPSNGVDESNAAEYLRAGATAVGIGAPLFDPGALASGDADAVAARARSFAASLLRASLPQFEHIR